MVTAAPERSTLIIPRPELRGAIMQLGKQGDAMVGVDGPAGTGKTFGILFFFHSLLLQCPGAKVMVARKSNTDLAGSAMATFQDYILHPAECVTYFGGNKVEPAAYRYPNGSKMVVNGLDKSAKVKSMEFDGIYINEATECDTADIEFCWGRLGRRGKMPVQPFVMDFNPDAPQHWLNQRMNEGSIVRLLSRHEDNPYLYDARAGDWTLAGAKYLARLDQLTGVRLLRLRYGQWAAAEGSVYQDSWDRARNLIGKFVIPKEWPRYLSIDFGFTNPFLAQWWAEDPDGRLFCYREIYMSHRLVVDHCRQIKALSKWGQQDGEPLPRAVICDPSAAEAKAQLRQELGMNVFDAPNDVLAGIQCMAARLRPAGDGRARMFFLRDALVERDQALADVKKPTSTVEEVEGYVWNTSKEAPVKEDDHGMDTARYMAAYRDLRGGVLTVSQGPQLF